MSKTTSTRTTARQVQTTRINGQKVRLVTSNGKVTITEAPAEEWRLQAEAVRQLRAMPEYAATAAQARAGSFTLAGDFNAGRRSRQESMKAKATGLVAGEADLRVYASGGRVLMLEYKNAEGRLSGEQKDRHALLRALGYTVEVIKAATPEECAQMSVATVRAWLAASAAVNDNKLPSTPWRFAGSRA